MSRPIVRLLAGLTVLAVACGGPTEVCGCSLVPASAIVTGQVSEAAGAPVAGARVALDGVPATMSFDPTFVPLDAPAVTGTDGRFVTRAFARIGTGELALRALVVRAGSSDTVRLRTGATARFGDWAHPDTVDVTLTLP